jgi:small subunit ribosomal protein S12
MSTLRQCIRILKKHKKRKVKAPALKGCPQKRGICFKSTVMKPKKPNSAIRKIAKVRLTTKRRIVAYICGIGHNVQEHNSLLVRGGRVRDLPGLHYKLIKGKLDFTWAELFLRRASRSKYGIPSYTKVIR